MIVTNKLGGIMHASVLMHWLSNIRIIRQEKESILELFTPNWKWENSYQEQARMKRQPMACVRDLRGWLTRLKEKQ